MDRTIVSTILGLAQGTINRDFALRRRGVDTYAGWDRGGNLKSMPCTSISPMLSVREGAQVVEFYKSAFGVKESFRIDAPDGALVARLSIESSGTGEVPSFWVADESPEHQNFSPETLNGGTARMVMVVDDPDLAFARAVAAGATVVSPVAEQYGWRLGRVVDPFGHHWEIGKPLS